MRTPYDDCPLCGCEDANVEREASCAGHNLYQPELPPTMRWLACCQCGHVFVDGYFTDEGLRVLFRETHASQTPGYDVAAARAVSARMIERTQRHLAAPRGRWLDVGFGNGALLTTAAEYGHDAVGLDLRPTSVARMRALGYEAYCVELGDFAPDARFSVVSMADVLEHIPFPKRALASAHRLLEDDGLLFVSMPNMDAFVWREMDARNANPYWGEIEHLHNFGKKRLEALLVETGFVPCSYGISERYIACMEIVARKVATTLASPETPVSRADPA